MRLLLRRYTTGSIGAANERFGAMYTAITKSRVWFRWDDDETVSFSHRAIND